MDSPNRFVCRSVLRQSLMPGMLLAGLGLAAGVLAPSASLAEPQGSPVDARAAVSASDAKRVFVSGISDTFDAVRAAIAKAQNETGRDYRVIVVGNGSGGKGGGKEPGAATQILDGVIDRWRQESAGNKTLDGKVAGFDPARDVTIVLDVKDRQLAMRAPWSLEVSSGLNPETIEQELIRKVFVPRAKDEQYDEGLADLVSATEAWVKNKLDRKLAQTQAARVFRTRTLPIGLAATGILGGLVAFFLQRSRHDRQMHLAASKLAALKSEVVALSDLLDSQQERHRMLPHADPDFQTPMQGQTRAVFDNVQTAIVRYRERWLGLMDVWEKAQSRIQSEWFLGTASADDAIQLLDSAEARPPLSDVAGECRGPLDVLENSHETARHLADELDATLTKANAQLAQLAQRGRSGASFQGSLAAVTRSLAVARHDLESDPVKARGRLEEAQASAATTLVEIDAFEAADDRRHKASNAADDVEKKRDAKRAEGWLLAEPGADPLARIVSVREHLTLATQLLDAGERTGAIGHIEHAERNIAEALAMLESIVVAKTKVEELLPGCVARLEALAARGAQALRALQQMAQSDAQTAWSDVADNGAKADAGLARAQSMVAEVRAAADPSRQHFFRALALLEEALRQEDWVDGCQAAIMERQSELDGLRASLPNRCQTVAARVQSLEARLERQRTDRVRANEHCREAGRLAEFAKQGAGVQRPDLLQASRVLEAADTAAARAEELATDDDRLARQAFEEIEEADGILRRATAWYAEGVSADVRGATVGLEEAKALLVRQRYEDSIKSSAEATRLVREAYATATAEAERRRLKRQQAVQQRQMEESFARMSRGLGPWVIQLPSGSFTGPDPWRSMRSPSGPIARAPSVSHSAGGSWSKNTAEASW